jgi:hypothetical protein
MTDPRPARPRPQISHSGAPPDLRLLRRLAESAELADPASAAADTDGRPLTGGDPLVPLARDIARALVEAGLALHHCARHHPLHRLGGVCLLPVTRAQQPGGQDGIVVSWTTHSLLSRDWDRWPDYHDTHQIMNSALGQILTVAGYPARPFGTGGAWIVTACQHHHREARQ